MSRHTSWSPGIHRADRPTRPNYVDCSILWQCVWTCVPPNFGPVELCSKNPQYHGGLARSPVWEKGLKTSARRRLVCVCASGCVRSLASFGLCLPTRAFRRNDANGPRSRPTVVFLHTTHSNDGGGTTEALDDSSDGAAAAARRHPRRAAPPPDCVPQPLAAPAPAPALRRCRR